MFLFSFLNKFNVLILIYKIKLLKKSKNIINYAKNGKGVQLFGRMEHHCVRPGTDPKNVTIADLAIPDTMCSPKQNRDRGGDGYECPPTMRCMKLVLSSHQAGFYGMFGDFGQSLAFLISR
jgi:hypothetical protein